MKKFSHFFKYLFLLIAMFGTNLHVFATTHIYTVTNAQDQTTGGATIGGSLRYELDLANANPSTDNNIINFAIPGAGEHVIRMNGGSVNVYRNTIIDGTSQDPGRDYTKLDPLIIICGDNFFAGVQFASDPVNGDPSGSSIKGIEFRNIGIGVYITTLGPSSTPTVHNITIENCVFFMGKKGDAQGSKYTSANDGIYITAAYSINIRGCFFGTPHNRTDSTDINYGVRVLDNMDHVTKQVEIGGAGNDACVFRNFVTGVYCDWQIVASGHPEVVDRVHVTRSPFLKGINPTTSYPMAIYLSAGSYSTYGLTNNNSILPPVITSIDPIEQEVKGTSTAGYQIEVFTSEGNQTAPVYVGTAIADAGGNWYVRSSTPITARQFFTATATDISIVGGTPRDNTSELAATTYCKEPVIRAQENCGSGGNTRPVLYIPDTYTNITWMKGSTAVQTGGTTLDTNGASMGPGSYTVVVSNGGGSCSFTSEAVTVP